MPHLPSLAEFKRATYRRFGIRSKSGLVNIDRLLTQWERGVQRGSAEEKDNLLLSLVDEVMNFSRGKGVARAPNGQLRVRDPRDPEGAVYALTQQALRTMAANNRVPPAPAQPTIAPQRLGSPNGAPVAQPRIARREQRPPPPPDQRPTSRQPPEPLGEDTFATIRGLAHTVDMAQMFYFQCLTAVVSSARVTQVARQLFIDSPFDDNRHEFERFAELVGALGPRVQYVRTDSLTQLNNAMSRATTRRPLIVCVGAPRVGANFPIMVMGTKVHRDIVGMQLHGFRVSDPRKHYSSPMLYQNGVYTAENIIGSEEHAQLIPQLGYMRYSPH